MRRALVVALVLVLSLLVIPQEAGAAPFRFTSGVASGDVTKTKALLWTRANKAGRVRVQVSKNKAFTNIVKTGARRAKRGDNFTVEIPITGLKPGNAYWYRFLGPGGAVSVKGRFETAPKGTNVKFVYSGDSDLTKGAGSFRSTVAGVLNSAKKENPDFFAWGGDTIYADSSVGPKPPAKTKAQYWRKYREQRSLAAVKQMLKKTSVIAYWDDHEVVNDYAGDKSSMPQVPFSGNPLVQPLTVGQVNRGQATFKDYFPVRETNGKHYRRLKWGDDLEVFVLDTRTYRTSPLSAIIACDQGGAPDVAPTLPQAYRTQFAGQFMNLPYLAAPPPAGCLDTINDNSRTMLGAAQKQWLKNGLMNSNATFKVVLTSVPIQELYALPYDRWEAYAAERLEILNFIVDNNIKGVAFLSTDTHAVLSADVCRTTLPACDDTGLDEVVVGPMGTDTFASQIDAFLGTAGSSLIVSGFFSTPQPNGLGLQCVNLDQPSYGLVKVNSTTQTLRVIPKQPVTGAKGTALPGCQTTFTP